MNGKNGSILIVSGGLLQVPAVEKAKSLGYITYVSDMNKDAPALKVADFPVILSTKDIDGHKRLAEKLKAKARLRGIYTQGADVAMTVAETARHVGLPGIDPEAARNCTSKYLMRKRLKEAGIDKPMFVYVKEPSKLKDAIDAVGLPAVIKPIDNCASRGVKIIHRIEEAESAFDNAVKNCYYDKAALIEEFLRGQEYSVDTVLWKGKLYPAGISDRTFDFSQGYSVQTGSLTPSLLPQDIQQVMYELMQKAADILGIDKGAFKGDLILVDGKPYIIEVTARTSGGFDSQYRKPYSFGIDIIKITMDIACGIEPDLRDLVPKWVKWSKTFTKLHKPGRIKKISGIKDAKAISGVKNIFMLEKEGDIISGLKNCADRRNFIIAVGDTLEQLNTTVKKALDTLNIEVEDA